MLIAVIPARAGSTRLPRKNFLTLGGKSLIALAYDCARQAGIKDIVVSTDDVPGVKTSGGVLPSHIHQRPKELASHDAELIDVVRDAVLWIKPIEPEDIIVLLQPTSPLRTPDDIVDAVALLREMKGDAVISVSDPLPAHGVMTVGHAGRLRPIEARRSIAVPNGAVFVITGEHLARGEDWWTGVTYGYWMPPDRSLDIDTLDDYQAALRRFGGP